MLILIPVDGADPNLSRVTKLFEVKKWALIDFDEGKVRAVTFHDDRTQTGADWIDFVILANKLESYMEFMEEGMMALCVREEETIEEIIEAFMFHELDEVDY